MNKESGSQGIKYKKLILPMALIASSVLIVFVIILPQITSISDQLSIIKNQQVEISVLKSSINVLAGQSEAQLDPGFTTAMHALPAGKEVTLIFSALSDAALASNTTLQDFSLTVGGVYGRAAAADSVGAVPKVSVIALIGGSDARGFVNFASELQKRLPLSEISKLNISGDSASIEIGFFYKPYDISKTIKQDKILPLSQADINLLNKLKEWEEH